MKGASASLKKIVEVPLPPVRSNPVVFMDITIDQEPKGRIVFELFRDVVPKTAENFRALCTGERGVSKYVWKHGAGTCPLHYKGIPFHRIIPNFIIQGGDVLRKNGRGNESTFGYRFLDESFEGKAREHLPGTLAMASHSPNQNGSQFFINLARNSHLDGRYVVFGQILEGGEVCDYLNKVGSQSGALLKRAWVADCGQSSGDGYMKEDFNKNDWYLEPPKEVLHNVGSR